jgi:hypothetical protein
VGYYVLLFKHRILSPSRGSEVLAGKLNISWNDVFCKFTEPGVSLEAGNLRKSPVTLAVTAGYFFSLKK